MVKLVNLVLGDFMKKVILDEITYELLDNVRDAFVLEDIKDIFTDYFYDYDYIVGDYAYSKLRLKGFYDATNKKAKDINNINNLDSYIKNQCAYNCKYFVLKRIIKK